MQINKSSKTQASCSVCLGVNTAAFSKNLLLTKYAESFSFYFSKPVNEILSEVKSSAEILYRDWLYFDDRREIMRRYYRNDESQIRLTNYTAYYANLDEFLIPCFEHLNARKIMFKRRKRKFKLNRRESRNGGPSSNSQVLAIVKKNRNFLRRLGNPTIYLDDLYVHNSTVENQQWSQGGTDRAHKKSEIIYDPGAEIHDIYDPVFSSDEEKDCRSLEKVPITSTKNLKANYRNDESKIIDRLNISNHSVDTKISELDHVNESIIKPGRVMSSPPTQQTLLDIMCLAEKDSTKKPKRKSPIISQRSQKQSSEITKATFLNFKKKDCYAKDEYTSLGNITKIVQDSGKYAKQGSDSKKNRVPRLDISPKNPSEITHLKNRCNSKNILSPQHIALQNRNSQKPNPSFRVNNSDDGSTKIFQAMQKNPKDKSQVKLSKKIAAEKDDTQEQRNGSPTQLNKDSKISINFSTRFKEKLKQNSFINHPLNCANEKLFKPEIISKVLSYQTSAQRELNYNLFHGAFNSENHKNSEPEAEAHFNSRQSNVLRKCPTDRTGKFVVKKQIESQTDHTKTYVSTLAKNSVDAKPPITLSCYVRSLLQRSQKKNKGKELQQTISNITKNDIVSKLQMMHKSPGYAQSSKMHLTNTLREFQFGENSGLHSNPSRPKLNSNPRDGNKPSCDKLYNTYSINRLVRPPFSPISSSKNINEKSAVPCQGPGFHLKAHSRKENRLDEYNFFQESPGQQLKVLIDFNRKPSLKKSARTGSTKNLVRKIECLSKGSKKNSKPVYNPLDYCHGANQRKGESEGRESRDTRDGVFISRLFKGS